MKNLVAIYLLFISSMSNAQICTIDYSQSGTGIYPDTLPSANVGQSYATDVTFVMPLDTLGYDFTNFHILSVSLPVGLSWQCNNNANNCDYNPQINQYGCVHISGTPLLAGQYIIDVTVIADLTIIQGYPFTFQIYMEVLPSTVSVSNTGFDMIGSSGCAPITVQFINNNPGLTSYLWNFGNGNISLNEQPAPQVYTNPGDYVVHYTAYGNQDTTHVYTLNSIHINSMSNYGNSFPSYDNADAYFKLFQNGTLIYQSSIIGDQNPPVQWNTNINLLPTSTYVIEIWEADDSFGEVILGGDDYMGNHTLNLNGCNGCGAGTSNFNYAISHQIIYPQAQVISQDTVHVYGYPAIPNIQFDSPTHTISTPDLGLAYQWYFNGSPISGATNPSHVVYQSGIYNVVAINTTGCVAFSDTLTAVYCNPFVLPQIQMNTANQLVLTNYPIASNIQWLLNGAVITNEQNDTLFNPVNGTYQVQLIDPFGCMYETAVFEMDASIYNISLNNWGIYPNPSSDEIHITIDSDLLGSSLMVRDLNGRILDQFTLNELDSTVNIQSYAQGTYIMEINHQEKYGRKKMVKF